MIRPSFRAGRESNEARMDLAKNSADGHTKSEHASGGGENGVRASPRQIRRKGECLADRWPSYASGRGPTNTLTPIDTG